ncbi:MAG: small ribosomal subunit Rsm22 family protein [Bdellovibrionaceae bacterium]|nr:small ribosomal subunit Rsm22 family protein [Pseudobdellovibrionaceae bacterium]
MALTLPSDLVRAIENLLTKQFSLRLSDGRSLAEHVKRLSDYYLKFPYATTPWQEKWCQIAQLVYFLPLNYLRIQAAWSRLPWKLDVLPVSQWTDVGCGLSPMGWYLHLNSLIKDVRLFLYDHDPIPLKMLRLMGLPFQQMKQPNWATEPKSSHGASFTFVLTELEKDEQRDKWHKGLWQFPFLFIVEPGLQHDGRYLLKIREEALKNNYFVLAPCTHHQPCPLKQHSKTDWCHDRVLISIPEWMKELQHYLPFKNHSLTFSYLILTTLPALKNHYESTVLSASKARVIGDTLNLKGKIQQAVCWNDTRSFLTYLKRDINSQAILTDLTRGQIIDIPSSMTVQGTKERLEIRLKSTK